MLAQATYAQDRLEEAAQLTHECEEAARPNDVHSQIVWRATRAKILAREGELDAAETLARAATDFAATSDFLLAQGDALMDLAEVLELAGKGEDAVAAIEDAMGCYERKGSVLAADRARARLAELE